MSKRHSVSSVDQLPEPIRKQVARLIAGNVTLDDILDTLKSMEGQHGFDAPSRSALGRWAKNLRAAQEKIQRSRAMAEAFGSVIEDKPDDQVFRANLEILQSSIMQLLTAVEEDEETGEVSAVTFAPKEVQSLAKALQSVASAQKIDADRTVKMREQIAREMAKKVEAVVSANGVSKDVRDLIFDAMLGADKA